MTMPRCFKRGADVFRVNMSHGSHMRSGSRQDHPLPDRRGNGFQDRYPCGFFQGPKLRVGVFAGDSELLVEGCVLALDRTRQEGKPPRVPYAAPSEFFQAPNGCVPPMLVNDGKIRFEG